MSASRNALALTCCLMATGCLTAPKSNPNPAVLNLRAPRAAPPQHTDPKPTPDPPNAGNGDEAEHNRSNDGPAPSDLNNFPAAYQNKNLAGKAPAPMPATEPAATTPAPTSGAPPVASATGAGPVKPSPHADDSTTKTSSPVAPPVATGPPPVAATPTKTAALPPTPPASPTAANTPNAPGPKIASFAPSTTAPSIPPTDARKTSSPKEQNPTSPLVIPLPTPGNLQIPLAAETPATQPGPVVASPGAPATNAPRVIVPPAVAGLNVPGTIAPPSGNLPLGEGNYPSPRLNAGSPEPNIKSNTLGPSLPAGGSVPGANPGMGAGMLRYPSVPVTLGPTPGPSISPSELKTTVPMPGGSASSGATGPEGGRAGPQLALNSRVPQPGINLDRTDHFHLPVSADIGAAHAPAPAASLIPLPAGVDGENHSKPVPIEFSNLFGASAPRASLPLSIPGTSGSSATSGAGADLPSGRSQPAISFNSITASTAEKPQQAVAGPALAFSAGFLGAPSEKDPTNKLMVPAPSGVVPQPAAPSTVRIFNGLAAEAAPAPSIPKPQSRDDTLVVLRNASVAHVALWSAVAPRGEAMTRAEAIGKVETADGSSRFVVVPLPENKSSGWQTIIDQTNEALGLVDWLADAVREEVDRREQLAQHAAEQQSVRAGREKLDHSVYDFLLGPATKPADKSEAK